MSQPSKRMIADLAQLAARHRAKEWEELADWIDDPEHRRSLRLLLGELAAASAASKPARPRKRRRPSGTTKVRESLKKLRAADAEQADLLDEVWLKLRQRELLPTLAAVRAFADALGAKRLKATRRDAAVTELMEFLIGLPKGSLEPRLREAASAEMASPSEGYEDWVRLILQRPGPGSESA